MKKTTIAASIAILGLAWAGASWYSGKQLENWYQEALKQSNTNLQHDYPTAKLSMQLQSYERGLFSSNARVSLSVDLGCGPAQELLFVDQLSHGPFPLPLLQQGSLKPVLASSRSALQENPDVKAWFLAAQGAVPLKTDMRISYGGDLDGTLTLAPLNMPDEQAALRFSGTTMQLHIGEQGRLTRLSADIESLRYGSSTEHSLGMNIRGLHQSAELRRNDAGVLLGTVSNSSKVSTLLQGQQMLLKGLDSTETTAITQTDNGIAINSSITLGQLSYRDTNLGAAQATVQAERLPAEAYTVLNSMLKLSELRSMVCQTPSDELNAQENAAFKHILPALLQARPTFSLKPLVLKNEQGQATANLSIALQPVAGLPESFDDLFPQAFEKLAFDMQIAKPMLAGFIAQEAIQDGKPAAQAQAEALDIANALGSMGSVLGLIKVQDNTLSSSIQYAADGITINGKLLSLNALMQLLSNMGSDVMRMGSEALQR